MFRIRTMMVTAETDIRRVMEALKAGADEYLMKPVTREALAEKLQILGFSPAAWRDVTARSASWSSTTPSSPAAS